MVTTKKLGIIMIPSENAAKVHGLSIRKDNGKIMIAPMSEEDHEQAEYQHLYFVSDAEIKEGDWVLWRDCLCKVVEILEHNNFRIIENGYNEPWSVHKSEIKKIEATTDESLSLIYNKNKGFSNNITEIPQSFIQEYVASNGTIKEVTVKSKYNQINGHLQPSEKHLEEACYNSIENTELYLFHDNKYQKGQVVERFLNGYGRFKTETGIVYGCSLWEIYKQENALNSNNEVIIIPKQEKLYTREEVYKLISDAMCKAVANDRDKIGSISETYITFIEDNL